MKEKLINWALGGFLVVLVAMFVAALFGVGGLKFEQSQATSLRIMADKAAACECACAQGRAP